MSNNTIQGFNRESYQAHGYSKTSTKKEAQATAQGDTLNPLSKGPDVSGVRVNTSSAMSVDSYSRTSVETETYGGYTRTVTESTEKSTTETTTPSESSAYEPEAWLKEYQAKEAEKTGNPVVDKTDFTKSETYDPEAWLAAYRANKTQSAGSDVKTEAPDGEFENDTKFPDELVKMLQEEAVKGARDGDYLSSKASQAIIKYAEDTVGPDRESLKMQMGPYLQHPIGSYVPKMISLMNGFSASLSYGNLDEAHFIYNSGGEKVLTYSHSHGGWSKDTTKAENEMETELIKIYEAAYVAERNDMRENGIQDKTGKIPNYSVSVFDLI